MPTQATMLQHYMLITSLMEPIKRTSDPQEISRAISVLQSVLQQVPDGSVDQSALLSVLGYWLFLRSLITRHLSDISGSISSFEKAAIIDPETEEYPPRIQSDLARSLLERFRLTGNLPDITQAIETYQRVLGLTPHGHPSLPVTLNDLGLSLAYRFDHLGDMSDLAEAISATQKAIHVTPDGHANIPEMLTNLGSCFARRFELTRELLDITEAISRHQRAIDLTPPGSKNLPGMLTNIAMSLVLRSDSTGDLADLLRAVSGHQRATELTPEGHPNMPSFSDHLGITLMRCFKRTKERSYITQSITALQRSVQLTPDADPHLPSRLNNLGYSLLHLCKCTHDMSDINAAVSVLRRAVQLTPAGHLELLTVLINLGIGLRERFAVTYRQEDLDESVASFKRAAHFNFGSPRVRLTAAKFWARWPTQHHAESSDILPAYDVVIGLIAVMAGLEQTVQGRYTQLLDVSGLALEAAASACSFQKLEKALEWLEAGRCLVWGQLNNLRTPLDDLRIHNHPLAQRVETLSKQLDNAGSTQRTVHAGMSLPQKISLEHGAHAHLKLAREWDALLMTIRAIPGFEEFLQPASCSTLLRNVPELGPIVVINVDELRCDAIALLAGLDEPLHIPLPNFSLTKANKYRHDLHAQLRMQDLRMREADVELAERALRRYTSNRVAGEGVVCQVLRSLWVEVVKPILDALMYPRKEEPTGDQPPRIWWCLTGPLSFLPIHAAGVYHGENRECILDYAISSYTPTVTAVTDRVRNLRPIDSHISGLFLTSQPDAPGASRIPGTTLEVQLIHQKALENKTRVRRVDGAAATIDECLEHMEAYSCIHLACHASQNASDPLQSQFLFHNGSLNLGTILQRNLKNADLAFLSACQTCAGEEKLSDEAVHLAAGMLAAGYRRVVATMWAIGDQHAPDVANDFYEYLWSHSEEGSGCGFDGSRSVYALHHAIQKLRQRLDNSEKSLLAWIPYVHFGY